MGQKQTRNVASIWHKNGARKMHIFLSLGQHPVDRIPPTHKQPGIPHIRLSIFIAVHKNLPDPSYFNLRDPHTHDVRNSEQFRK